eukprot:jgi/Picre1/30107/NNA_005476.t1
MKPQVTKHGRLIRPVSESARIDIAKVIADFQASDEQEHAFPPDLTNHERAIVHNECKKYGLISKSFGKGSTRAVHVFKQRKQRSNKETCYTFSLQNETLSRIEAYLERFPPSRDEISTIVGDTGQGAGKVPHKKTRQKRAMDMEQSEITSRHDRWLNSMNTGKGKDMERIRKSLPIAKHKEEILQAVESSQVVLIAGETGCGKTTQVPQYIQKVAGRRESRLFSKYFGGCPIIRVPGFTFPVKDYFLEDVLRITGYEQAAMRQLSMELGHAPSHTIPQGSISKKKAKALSEAIESAFKQGDDDDFERLLDSQGLQTQNPFMMRIVSIKHYQSNTDVDDVDIGLIEELLLFVCGEKRQGKAVEGLDAAISAVESDASAILIFLPGWDEIMRLKDALDQSGYFGNPQKYIVLPLHSMVSPVEQRKVFQRPPRNVRKIILSTNIAETAITIDDVALIIDSGRQKEKSFDPYSGVSTLQSGWISKASAKQRKGRAGRCRKGLAFHMYSRQRYEAMDEYQAPELMRTPLEEMGLQVKLIDDNTKIGEFLSKAVEPPVSKAVDSAIKLLENIGAIEEGTEKLTVLGSHLARLPIPPKLGKLLLYGVLFDCLDPILTLSCCLAYRDPWVLPASVDGRRRASQIKVNFSSRGSGFSDHLATAVAYNEWKQRQRSGNGWTYCNQNFLNNATMTMIDGMRTQLLGELMDKGFITSLESASSKATRLNLVRSVIALGLYPNIGRVAANPRRDQKSKAAMINARGERVRVHPSSVNISIKNPVDTQEDLGRPSLLVYDELTRGDAVIYVKSAQR